jgi:formate/nitrite transporter
MNDQQPRPVFAIDAYSPSEIALKVQTAGVGKVSLPLLQTLTLSVLAGAFIAFGAMFFTIVVTDSGLGFGPTRLLGGVAFSLGLVLVIVAGAELFTGNNLAVMAWADRRISTRALLRNWLVVYVGNLIGAVASALFVAVSGILGLADGAVGSTAAAIAAHKAALPIEQAFARGLLCNALVCLAVWLSYAARDVAGKILAIMFPISAFVALGFEHSIANMYLLSAGILAGASIGVDDAASNLVWVTLGNIVGGAGLVGLVYWIIYVRQSDARATRNDGSGRQ